MKKRSVLLFFLLLTVLPCAADPVDALRATEVARAFFQNDHNVALRLAPLQRVERVSAPLTKAGEEQVPFYIFNRGGGGFVLIAADDACNPILGYSFTHSFGQGDDMPEGLAAWLDDLEEQVALAREATVAERQQALPIWEAVFVRTKTGGNGYQPAVKHETAEWGQKDPFNRLAPTIGGKKAERDWYGWRER